METKLELQGVLLNPVQERHIRHQLDKLGQRLTHRPEPIATLVLALHANQRNVEAKLQVQLGPLGRHLVSRRTAEMPDEATRLAVEDIARELERQISAQRGEETYGVPSRREPASLRPTPMTGKPMPLRSGPEVATDEAENHAMGPVKQGTAVEVSTGTTVIERMSLVDQIETELAASGLTTVDVGLTADAVVLTGTVDSINDEHLAELVASALAPGRQIEDNLDIVGNNPRASDVEVIELEELEPDFTGQYPGADLADVPEDADAEPAFAPTDPVGTPNDIIGGFEGTSMDSLEIDGSSLDAAPGDEALAEAVRRELREDAVTSDLVIDVSVRRGAVHLRGNVQDLEDAENAEEVAGRLPAVREVVDELNVTSL